jgi:hypothetical protein
MLTERWTKLRPHRTQHELWRTQARRVFVRAGRGSGKSDIAKRRVVAYLPHVKPWPDPKYFYALPTYQQAKKVAWFDFLNLIPKHWLASEPTISDMTIRTIFGSELYIVGLDKPARIEGIQVDGGVVDERADQKPGVVGRTLRPMLTHRKGWLWEIGVPKRYGCGAKEFNAGFEAGLRGEAGMQSFTWPSWDILPEEEIKQAQLETDPKDFKEQYGGEAIEAGGTAFYQFNREYNLRPVTYKQDRVVVVGSDFNVDPMAWVLCHYVDTPYGQGLEVFDEIWLHNANTQRTLDTLHNRYSSHAGGWEFIGDASGKARKTSASTTDYQQILNDKRFKGHSVRYPESNPAVRDRLTTCNVLLRNAAGQVKLFIDPRCIHLIDDLEHRGLKPDGNPDDSSNDDMGHISDALGYIVYMKFPLTTRKSESMVIIGG